MKYILNNIVIICLLCCCSSKSTHNEITDIIRNQVVENEIAFDDSLRSCLIIPGAGCSGCIASGIGLVKANKDYFSRTQDAHKIIFTHVLSLKALRRRTMGLDYSELNYQIDSINKYFFNCSESKYPIILYLNKGMVVKADYAAPNTDGMALYMNFLLKSKN